MGMPYFGQRQGTIKDSVDFSGINVFSGKKNVMVLHPAKPDEGIVFRYQGKDVRFVPENVKFPNVAGLYSTVALIQDGVKISLFEHLVPTLRFGASLDNVIVELSDGVCPTFDMADAEYLGNLIEKRKVQDARRRFWKFSGKVSEQKSRVGKPDNIIVESDESFRLSCFVDYAVRSISKQMYESEVTSKNFVTDLAAARPFAGEKIIARWVVNACKRFGRDHVLGINERNYLLISSQDSMEFSNPQSKVRYDGKEPVRHKSKDVLAALAGYGFFKNTKFTFDKTGHRFDFTTIQQFFDEGLFERV